MTLIDRLEAAETGKIRHYMRLHAAYAVIATFACLFALGMTIGTVSTWGEFGHLLDVEVSVLTALMFLLAAMAIAWSRTFGAKVIAALRSREER